MTLWPVNSKWNNFLYSALSFKIRVMALFFFLTEILDSFFWNKSRLFIIYKLVFSELQKFSLPFFSFVPILPMGGPCSVLAATIRQTEAWKTPLHLQWKPELRTITAPGVEDRSLDTRTRIWPAHYLLLDPMEIRSREKERNSCPNQRASNCLQLLKTHHPQR